ncbi:hypothetical protein, partial [Heyndrickxia sporothermodurans]|uniref:hypothetical protein n=1 Tax=Heyndrickxia sporothermodurans TaxID=46224 RepID=UPI001F30CAAD
MKKVNLGRQRGGMKPKMHEERLCKLFCVNDFVTIFLTILKYMFLPARGIGQCWGATRAPSRVL